MIVLFNVTSIRPARPLSTAFFDRDHTTLKNMRNSPTISRATFLTRGHFRFQLASASAQGA